LGNPGVFIIHKINNLEVLQVPYALRSKIIQQKEFFKRANKTFLYNYATKLLYYSYTLLYGSGFVAKVNVKILKASNPQLPTLFSMPIIQHGPYALPTPFNKFWSTVMTNAVTATFALIYPAKPVRFFAVLTADSRVVYSCNERVCAD
jgi:hypothetical protein